MDATVRIPEAYGTVFTATEDIITVGVKPRGEYATFVTFQNVHFLLRKIFHAHRFFQYRNGTQRGLSKIVSPSSDNRPNARVGRIYHIGPHLC
jgi:hypothetical protein